MRRSKEDHDRAIALAKEIERVREFHVDDPELQLSTSAGMILQLLGEYEDRLQAVMSKSVPAAHAGYQRETRRRFRVNNIRVQRSWFGYGCDICGGDPEQPVFMALEIGSWRGRLILDVCKDCAKRLSERVDAAIESR